MSRWPPGARMPSGPCCVGADLRERGWPGCSRPSWSRWSWRRPTTTCSIWSAVPSCSLSRSSSPGRGPRRPGHDLGSRPRTACMRDHQRRGCCAAGRWSRWPAQSTSAPWTSETARRWRLPMPSSRRPRRRSDRDGPRCLSRPASPDGVPSTTGITACRAPTRTSASSASSAPPRATRRPRRVGSACSCFPRPSVEASAPSWCVPPNGMRRLRSVGSSRTRSAPPSSRSTSSSAGSRSRSATPGSRWRPSWSSIFSAPRCPRSGRPTATRSAPTSTGSRRTSGQRWGCS